MVGSGEEVTPCATKKEERERERSDNRGGNSKITSAKYIIAHILQMSNGFCDFLGN